MAARLESREVLAYLRGGLNTALDPSSIGLDQLTEAVGLEYHPPRLGLFGVPGRSRADYGATALGGNKVHGVHFVRFDPDVSFAFVADRDWLVVFSGASAFFASAESDGRFQAQSFQNHFNDNTATAFTEAVYLHPNWFFYNGEDRNLHWTGQSQRFEKHGKFEITSAGTVAATAVAGSSIPVGTYQFWHTEKQTGIAESAYEAAPAEVTITATGTAVRYTFPNGGTPFNDAQNVGHTFVVYAGEAGQKYPFGYAQQNVASGSTSALVTALATGIKNVIQTLGPDFPYSIVAPLDGVPISADGQPPIAYCMVTFQNTLVCIDAENRVSIRYALAGSLSSFPASYELIAPDGIYDKLNCLAVCNGTLLVFSSFAVHRIDDLPRHTDPEPLDIAAGRAFVPVMRGHGCLSPRGAATFSIFGSGELCLFVCRDGVHITDGARSDYASSDIDWYNLVDLASLSRATMRNNPRKHRVELYYADKTTPTSWKRLDFYYHPALLGPRQGAGVFPHLPILGPTPVPGPAVAVGILNSDWQVWTGNDNAASVWVEGTGTSDGANLEDGSGTITKTWKTRDYYFGGIDSEFDLETIYTHQSQTTASGSYTVTGSFRDDEAGTYIVTATVDQSLKNAQPHFGTHNRAQAINIRGSKADGGTWQELDYLVFVVNRINDVRTAKSNV